MTENNKLGLVVNPTEVEAVLDNEKLLILDLSRESVYQQAHIPGAIFLDPKLLVSGEQPASGKIPDEAALSKLFSELGLTEDTHVITYDDEGGGWAGRLIWTLDCIGHNHYSYLDGGIHAWLEEQKPVEQKDGVPTPSQYQAKINTSAKVDKEYILNNLDSDQMVIWDARSRDEFDGVRNFAARAGHIPGAKHYEWTTGMNKENALRIRDLNELKNELADIGITADKTIVTHCQTHHRSGFTYLLGKILGFADIKAYDGSWSEWGNDENTPVETSL